MSSILTLVTFAHAVRLLPSRGWDIMHVLEQEARPALRPFIERFLVVDVPSLHHDAHLPDVRPVAAFTFRGQVRIAGHGWAPQAAFTGPRDALSAHDHCDHHGVVLATFTPAGASAFLGAPLNECSGAATDLRAVLRRPREFDRLHDQLADATGPEQRVALLEGFMLCRIRDVTVDPLVAAAVEWLVRGIRTRRIDDLARYIGLSQSALERRFQRVVGTSPKKFLSIIRLQRAARMLDRGGSVTTVAHAAGYFDESHFIRDFRRATGATPRAFFRKALVR